MALPPTCPTAGKYRDFCDWFGPKIDEYEKLITSNPICRRIEGLGMITRDEAINWSLSDRSAGLRWPWDLRKVDHYECYDDFDWNVAWEKEGDCFARYRVRIEEINQSLKILRQACDMIPGGPTENLEARRIAEQDKRICSFSAIRGQESRPPQDSQR